ncbi:hypothetical protein MPSEU_000570400 [Mayamaea pseudoterrestris]|nr:hypothetical protein MPSEU_000570400 [Mayamaea pseudoterrestris]
MQFVRPLVFICLSPVGASAFYYKTEQFAPPSSTQIDLSYTSHLRENVLIETIHKLIQDQSVDESSHIVEIDVSSSSLRDNNLTNLMDDATMAAGPIHLVARCNRLTAQGVSQLIDQILTQSARSKRSKNDDDGGAERPNRIHRRRQKVDVLDIGWNRLGHDAPGSQAFCQALELLIRNVEVCPKVLRLDRSGIGPSVCRAIAKGLMHRVSSPNNDSFCDINPKHDTEESLDGVTKTELQFQPLSLSLSGNSKVGDAGLSALAAAIRTILVTKDTVNKMQYPIFQRLDLCGCSLKDIGVDAFAMAMEKANNRLCVEELDFGANAISDNGAVTLGRVIAQSSCPCIGKLILSGNGKIGDRGAIGLAEAISTGKLRYLELRSCHVQADGAAAIGKAMCVNSGRLEIDLSGNPIGILLGKSKKDGGKYSAGRLKSHASATAVSYMSQGMGFLKKGFKEVGMDTALGVVSGESDDEEEDAMRVAGGLASPTWRCGAKALANAFLDELDKHGHTTRELSIQLGLRHCSLDHGAADALAAMMIAAREHDIDLKLDLCMNMILEDDMIAALEGRQEHNDQLVEMAERHMDARDAMRGAAAKAEAAGQSRETDTVEFDASWDMPINLDIVNDAEWDSGAGAYN